MLLRLITHEHNDPAAGSLRKRTHIHETRARVATHPGHLWRSDASLCLSTHVSESEKTWTELAAAGEPGHTSYTVAVTGSDGGGAVPMNRATNLARSSSSSSVLVVESRIKDCSKSVNRCGEST